MRAEPIQTRAVLTRTRLLDAAKTVYDIHGRDKFDTKLVAATAGVSIGTVYRYFDDRVDIMDAIYPDRDLPTMDQIERIARWVEEGNSINDAGSNPREILTFLEEAF